MKTPRVYTIVGIIFILAIGSLFYIDYLISDLDITENKPEEMVVDSTTASDSLTIAYDPFSEENIKNMNQRELRNHLQVLESYRMIFPEKEDEIDSLMSRVRNELDILGF